MAFMKIMDSKSILYLLLTFYISCCEATLSCRDRSSDLRQDGGLCFEIPPWQHEPVQLEKHLARLYQKWGNGSNMEGHIHRMSKTVLINSEASKYMDTVLLPFLDTYHRNVQNSYQQFAATILKKIKQEINAAVIKKHDIFKDLTRLANDLNVPSMCDEDRREARTIASEHVAKIYECTEDARASIAKMGKYAEEMISITRSHMDMVLQNVAKEFRDSNDKKNVKNIVEELSQSAVALGYELDLSITNARRHNEQSCEQFSSCSARAHHQTDVAVSNLKDILYQCVYA